MQVWNDLITCDRSLETPTVFCPVGNRVRSTLLYTEQRRILPRSFVQVYDIADRITSLQNRSL